LGFHCSFSFVGKITSKELTAVNSNDRFATLKNSTMKLKTRAALAAFFILCFSTAFSQDFTWTPMSLSDAKNAGSDPQIHVSKASYFSFSSTLARVEFSDELTMELPLADGSFKIFSLKENTTMSEGLKEKFPDLRAYDAIATDGSGYLGKVDFSSKGFHAMLFHPIENTQFIDPLYAGENTTHVVYRKSDFTTDKQMNCEADFDLKGDGLGDPKSGTNYNSCVLRTYRIAISATGEYTNFHGGSVADALAAQVTTMNRVNGVYERDFGVTMSIVPNNDEIIFTNPSTDPFSNGETFAMINQNPTVINNAIGLANYDIGHVFGTNSGGLAGFGVTCDFDKARGVTGSGAPIGDPFDIDYVAHEIGHQFGASHTFNNFCSGNRADNTAVEPGSGSTIMAYAGICPPNVQNNSDDHFHGISMRQIGLQISSDNCPVVTSLENLAPVLDSVTTDFFIPAQTPFSLTAFASDPDEGDLLTYNFEQMDNEITEQPPVATATEGPMFRSFSPTTNPTQYFPRLETLTGSGNTTWQVLPSVDRTMNFRCTVKDNAAGGGCAQYEDLEFEVVSEAGPFVVTQPSSGGIVWEAFTGEEVTWSVADTDLPPINADLVDILLSVDGGLTYPYVLADDVPNDGEATVSVPNAPTEDARVMVTNAERTFFDISNTDFTIIGLTNGFLIQANDTSQTACIGEDLQFEISLQGVGGFNEVVTLSLEGVPAEVDATLDETVLTMGESTTLTISNTENVDPGIQGIIVVGMSETFQQSLVIEAGFNSNQPEIPTLVSPEDGAEFTPTDITLDWQAVESPDALYTIELSPVEDFSSDVTVLTSEIVSEISVAGLAASTEYFWRVMKETSCSIGEFSETFSFGTHSCFPFESEDVPVNLSPIPGDFFSTIEIPFEGTVEDLNVISLEGDHANIGQLTFSLLSPSGVEVVLIDEICESTANFNLGFDDSSELLVADCPATSGLSYKPDEELSAFIGEQAEGTWTLIISDNVSGGGGSLLNWSIEICIAGAGSFVLTTQEDVVELCQDESISFDVNAEEVFAFSETIDLTATDMPSGLTIEFNPSTISVGESSEITLTAASDVAGDIYIPTIVGTSGDLSDELTIPLELNLADPEPLQLSFPTEGEETTTIVNFDWEESVSPSATYTIEVATDPELTDIVASEESLLESVHTFSDLPPSQNLYWRVSADNGCEMTVSEIRSFTTLACVVNQSEDLPVNISPIAGIYESELEIDVAGPIQSISIPNIEGTHFRVSDLIISLVSPEGTEVVLFSEICEGDQDFNLGFSDDATIEVECPPTSGIVYNPSEALTAFAGEEASGTWILRVEDVENGGGGELNDWSLQVCYEGNVLTTYRAEARDFSIFPNPTEGYLTVLSKDKSIESVRILDISGRLLQVITNENDRMLTMDLSKFDRGAYLIQVGGEFGTVTKKVIRQ
jgi:subtilisin-like proprotein convertase family protein